MKKIIASVMCFVLALLLFACGTQKAQSIGTPAVPEDTVIMQGKVIEIENGKMVVEPIEGSAELRSSDRFSVPMEHMDALPEPQVGYIEEIIYDGSTGAKDTFTFELNEDTCIIAVYRNSNFYEQVLVKSKDGSWERAKQ